MTIERNTIKIITLELNVSILREVETKLPKALAFLD